MRSIMLLDEIGGEAAREVYQHVVAAAVIVMSVASSDRLTSER
jgi:hypothetical protein